MKDMGRNAAQSGAWGMEKGHKVISFRLIKVPQQQQKTSSLV